MENPWKQIGVQHVHIDDLLVVRQHNRAVENKKPQEQIQREVPPLPYIGNPLTARVLLLGKNPSYDDIDETDMDRLPALMDENFKALTFESEYPFFYLDPRFSDTNGYRWWREALGAVLDACARKGTDTATALSHLACAQYHPYHSRSSFVSKSPFPTQEYTFSLVREAAADPTKIFVILYGAANERLWRAAVPEIPANAIRLKSAQTASLTSRNISEPDWERLITALSTP